VHRDSAPGFCTGILHRDSAPGFCTGILHRDSAPGFWGLCVVQHNVSIPFVLAYRIRTRTDRGTRSQTDQPHTVAVAVSDTTQEEARTRGNRERTHRNREPKQQSIMSYFFGSPAAADDETKYHFDTIVRERAAVQPFTCPACARTRIHLCLSLTTGVCVCMCCHVMSGPGFVHRALHPQLELHPLHAHTGRR
jgi:hypothetical protein